MCYTLSLENPRPEIEHDTDSMLLGLDQTYFLGLTFLLLIPYGRFQLKKWVVVMVSLFSGNKVEIQFIYIYIVRNSAQLSLCFSQVFSGLGRV